MSEENIVNAEDRTVGVAVTSAMLAEPMTTPCPSPGSRPLTAVDPPGGELGPVALRWSAVKLVGWLAITLHCCDVCEFWPPCTKQ